MLNRRHVSTGLLVGAATGLVGACAPGAKMPTLPALGAPTKPQNEDVHLKEDGTPEIADLMKAGPLGDKALGRADAPVTVIKYASMTCPYCRHFHTNTYPAFKKAYIDKGKVRFILREFPIGHASGTATIIMRCAGQKDDAKYFSLYDKFITKQKLWVAQEIRYEQIYKVASETGMTRKEFDACLKNQEVIEGLKWVKQRGRKLGVHGTPTFFINGKKSRGVLTLKQIQGMIDPFLT